MADKDLAEVVANLNKVIDTWHIFTLTGVRALPMNEIVSTLKKINPDAVIYQYSDLFLALNGAMDQCKILDKVVAFGSFLVVSGVLKHLSPSTL